MRRNRESIGAALMAAMLLLPGCEPQKPEPYAQLPEYELDLQRNSPVAEDPPPAVGQDAATTRPADSQTLPAHLRPWRYIVIHHSASASGNAITIDAEHRHRGFDEMGYHFVITNGNGGPDGEVQSGSRWLRQKWGAHTGGTPNNEYNNYGIGVCLIGDFTDHPPTDAQLASLHELVFLLAGRLDIPAGNVIGHRDAPNAATECPGDHLESHIRQTLRSELEQR